MQVPTHNKKHTISTSQIAQMIFRNKLIKKTLEKNSSAGIALPKLHKED